MDFSQLSVQEINVFLKARKQSLDLRGEFLDGLALDSRKKVRELGEKYQSWLTGMEEEKKRLISLYSWESKLLERGYNLIAGIDEAGRGPLAGPVVAAAVILPQEFFLPGLNDSKKLSAIKRNELYSAICEQAVAVGVGMSQPREIDQINILRATHKAMERAVENMNLSPQYLLIDGNSAPAFQLPYLALVGGDSISASIAAASIIAKVTRDRLMEELHNQYPQYGFAKHKGYGTREHVLALEQYGVTPIHRLSFELVNRFKNYLVEKRNSGE